MKKKKKHFKRASKMEKKTDTEYGIDPPLDWTAGSAFEKLS